MSTATALARPNIALIKYWGKRDTHLNLPETGSLSLTLSRFHTRTTVTVDPNRKQDRILLNGQLAVGREAERVVSMLDLIRRRYNVTGAAEVVSENNFPTASGLASSASGFAALVLAATHAWELAPSFDELADLARRGSGSAPRSLAGGLALYAPEKEGDTPQLQPLGSLDPLPLNLLVAVTTQEAKKVGSTEGMQRTRETSPYYKAWIDHNRSLLKRAWQAAIDRDFTTLGQLTETSCFGMHSVMMSATPPLIYWNPTTLALIQKVWELRESGLEAYVTIDAGPHVKVLCQPENSERLQTELSDVAGVQEVWIEEPGRGAELLR